MAIYSNIINDYREIILEKAKFNDIIDELIGQQIVDFKQYNEIWSKGNGKLEQLLNFIIKDGKHIQAFIKILSERYSKLYEKIQNEIDITTKVITTGEFPHFPLNFVVRNSVADKVKREVLSLEYYMVNVPSILVIHGAPGFGKSYLVNQVLQTKECVKSSGNAMFWISLGEYQNKTNIIYALWNLYQNAGKLSNKNIIKFCPETVENLQRELNKLFQENRLKNAILVLDDVKSAEILQVFRLSCKLVVTTQDKEIAANSDHIAKFISITRGFTEKESLELLSKSLEANIDFVQLEAQNIHRACLGYPMLIGIIGNILKDSREEALASSELWTEIHQEINGEYALNDSTTPKVLHMIQKCVDRLQVSRKTYFHKLSVFGQHVNIKTSILIRLWGLTKREVRKIMLDLEHQALVVSFYNNDLQEYVYSIHSLMYTYLMQHQPKSIIEDHKTLISFYDQIKNGSNFKDPVNQYVMGYYGFHAKKADLLEKFENFLDLEFIERKIKFVGSADLLTDYTIYKEIITRNEPDLEKKLDDLKEITRAYSSHLNISPETNIIQFVILFGDCKSNVYTEAEHLANKYNDQLYFRLTEYSEKNKVVSIITNQEGVSCVIFLESKKVLIGYKSGLIEIKVFNQYVKTEESFQHSSEIISLVKSPNRKKILTISKDVTKLWILNADLDPKSPKAKQFDWQELHLPDDDASHKTKSFQMEKNDFIISAAFPNIKSNEIITGSALGTVTKWNTNTGATICQLPNRGFPITSLLYTPNDEYVLFYCYGKIYHYSINKVKDNEFKGQLSHSDTFKALYLVPDPTKNIIIINQNSFELWNYQNKVLLSRREIDKKIVSSIVSSNYLILATDNHKICLYHLENDIVTYLDHNYGLPNNMFLISNEKLALIYVNGLTMLRCELSLEQIEMPIVKDLQQFAIFWKGKTPIFPIRKNHCIDLFFGCKINTSLNLEAEIKITTMVFKQNYLVFGTINGYLYFYNYDNKNLIKKRPNTEKIVALRCFNDQTLVLIYEKRLMVVDENVEKNVQVEFESKFVDLFYLQKQIIIIEENSIKIWDLSNSKFQTFQHSTQNGIILAGFNQSRALVAITCREETRCWIKILNLKCNNMDSTPEPHFIKLEPKICCFSFDGELMALGYRDGRIQICLVDQTNKITKDVWLEVHKSVESLLFAPFNEPFLVSCGDQVAWWNLTDFQSTDYQMNEMKMEKMSLFNADFKNKKVNEKVPFLLNSTNIHAKSLKYISSSDDFQTFFIVDSRGSIFVMDFVS